MWRKYNFWVGTLESRELVSTLLRCAWNGSLRNGPDVSEFERQFASLLEVHRAYGFAAGRMALYAILKSIGEPERDEVILPAYTCVVVPTAILYAGYRPVYVDIDAGTFQIDPQKVRAAINTRTRAIVAPHNFGLPCDLTSLSALAAERDLVLIEDCAQSLGSRWRGRHLGTYGDFGFFSTDTTKNICTGFGGIAVVNNERYRAAFEAVYQQADVLSWWHTTSILLYVLLLNLLTHPSVFRIGKYAMAVYRRTGLAFLFPGCERPQKPHGYPYPARLSNALGRLGLGQLRRFDAMVSHRKQAYQALIKLLSPHFRPQKDSCDSNPAPLRVTFLVQHRREFQRFLAGFLEVGTWFDNVLQNYRGDPSVLGYRPGTCPVAEEVAQHIVNLPTSPRTDDQLLQLLRNALSDERRVRPFLLEQLPTGLARPSSMVEVSR